MATRSNFKREEIRKGICFDRLRTTIESAFYSNNVKELKSLKQAYEYAKETPGVTALDMPVYKPKEQGLPSGAKILLNNDGKTVGRYAKARVIFGDEGVKPEAFCEIAREAVYDGGETEFISGTAVIGLDSTFTVKAHLMVPKRHAIILYSWLLNFQYYNDEIARLYKESKLYPEGDIYMYSNPDYEVPGRPGGLALFDPAHNCAMILGMRYFGEHKKGALTLAWAMAGRHGYVACHGGMKQYTFENQEKFTFGVFGLSGSGKSTLTHEKHGGKYSISILHDDAYVISTENGSAVAMEPTYFDKTQDYPVDHPSNKFLLTVQNCGVTIDEDGKKVLVTEDVRNGNGRAIKSAYWTDNRVNYIAEPVNAIVWLMKDDVLPPILKITDPALAAVMGATLATKRSTAEKLDADVDAEALVIEPYANPFRTYPLVEDYVNFKKLFEQRGVACYIFNTGTFLSMKIPKEVTLSIMEDVVTDSLISVPFMGIPNLQTSDIMNFEAPRSTGYAFRLKRTLEKRVEYLTGLRGTKNELPIEAEAALKAAISSLGKFDE